jgi:hypothetical protein
MEEKIESEKSKMESTIHSSQRKENAEMRGGDAMPGTPLFQERGWGELGAESEKSKIESKIHEPQSHEEREVFPNFPVTN